MTFQAVPPAVRFPDLEERILRFWKEQGIYEKSLEQRASAPPFVFYEGPPTANGMPHPGHCLTRAIKDLFPRYRTMRGYLCERKAGWDTHGLPVEVEVCKELGIHSKEEIEAYGVEPFIHKCQESVLRYMQEWERLTERLGFWVDLDEAYVTYHQSYVESVWWSLKNLFDRGLLYQGHKIVWWWAQGGTALSAAKSAKATAKWPTRACIVRFPLVDDAGKTTTRCSSGRRRRGRCRAISSRPCIRSWSTRSVAMPRAASKLIIAAALVETIAGKVKRELDGRSDAAAAASWSAGAIVPPFDYYYKTLGEPEGQARSRAAKQHVAWRVVAADFVTIDSGTGVVHQAPAFGEVDFDVLHRRASSIRAGRRAGADLRRRPRRQVHRRSARLRGPLGQGGDKDIAARSASTRAALPSGAVPARVSVLLAGRRRSADPVSAARVGSSARRSSKTGCSRTTSRSTGCPSTSSDGRFGNFLEIERRLGPLARALLGHAAADLGLRADRPAWKRSPATTSCWPSRASQGTEVWDAAKKAKPELSDDLKVHKPYIDAVTYDSPFAAGRAHAPRDRSDRLLVRLRRDAVRPVGLSAHRAARQFAEQFPADFISEAIDQTRGWFYSQLAISTLLFGDEDASSDRSLPHPVRTASARYPHPFRNCIVLGLMLGEDGQKMSKSKRNYREPSEIFDKYGADALRWYFFANQPPWTSIRYSEQAIKDSIPEFLLRLWNVYSFFVIYANIDGFDPAAELAGEVGQLDAGGTWRQAKSYRPVAERERARSLDPQRAEPHGGGRRRADGRLRQLTPPAGRSPRSSMRLSNWYVRRSRDRFWSERQAGRRQARRLLDAVRMPARPRASSIAPFVPFLAETLWQNLAAQPFGGRARWRACICATFPPATPAAIDEQLSERMSLVREIVSLGRSARMAAKLKVRQPLAKVEVMLADATHQPWLEQHAELIAEELNVKQVEFADQADEYITYTVLARLKRLGPRLGKQLPAVKKALAEADGGELMAELRSERVRDARCARRRA